MRRLPLALALCLSLALPRAGAESLPQNTPEIEVLYEADPQGLVPEPTPAGPPPTPQVRAQDVPRTGQPFVITVGGDCSLGIQPGWEEKFDSFTTLVGAMGEAYPFSGIVGIFSRDDMTLVNLEGPLTHSTDKQKRPVSLKGPPGYVRILQQGSVEAVNLANNHILDYGEEGKAETIATLDQAGIVHSGGAETAIFQKGNIRVGMIGHSMPYNKNRLLDISPQVRALRDAGCQIVIASFHWGSEYKYEFTREQRQLARAAIDAGADVVVGHHPHVIQGIEKYKDRYILYSLGNLVFGGWLTPRDRDSFLAQLTFYVDPDIFGQQAPPQLSLLPVLITDQTKGTDYRPVLPDEHESDRILRKILQKSSNMNDF
ncbi:MAG: CapA family protein [Oscillospiraceae bacterium]|nr:CapA family protein [Oscillospiraceae bacterium]